ncbi:ISL3 family transposase [Aerococcus viridans]|uniref:ISL3 family transposase n=1 Tax=Aerococcus viridans TaxID=1377 RepID=UPI003B21CB27
MSQSHSIRFALDIKDKNITFGKNNYSEKRIKGKQSKVFYGNLTYHPTHCANCGMENNSYSIIKYGYKTSRLTLNSTTHYPTYLELKKQRFYCKCCQTTFSAETKEVDRSCFIVNAVKQSIAVELQDKISMKDLAKRHFVSPVTVTRIIEQFAKSFQINFNSLPEHLSFDEFKSVKSVAGKLSFIYADSKDHSIIGILPSWRLSCLKEHFQRYPLKVRNQVKTIVIDMNTPYFSLIHTLFPKAKIIIDRFHLVQLISRSLNKIRIKLMNHFNTSKSEDKKNNRKLKRYCRLLLKCSDKLNYTNYAYHRPFKGYKSETEIVDYLLSLDPTLKDTYQFYQDLLYAIHQNDFESFGDSLNEPPTQLSSYIKTSVKTLKKYAPAIQNTFVYAYSNGPLEGINNKIKVIKRIAFGFRSFTSFRNRILLSCNTQLKNEGFKKSAS